MANMSKVQTFITTLTPTPSDNEWLYGHNWVTAAILAPHSQWGTIALPVLADMYVRKVDIPPLNAKHGLVFRTKIEIARCGNAWTPQEVWSEQD